MTALITLNATVAEIEDALLTGRSVKDVARDLTSHERYCTGGAK